MFTRFCAAVSKLSLMLAVVGLIAVILCVQWQVIGRYIFNDTPTWAENLALLLVLFVTAFGLAVAVPAVMGYNWLIRRNKTVMEQIRAFSGDVHNVLLAGKR